MRITGFCALIVFALIGNAHAQSTASVRGTVTDGQTQGYLPGATIELSGTTHRATTGDDGRYRLDGVAAGTYPMTITYVGYNSYEGEVTVSESGTTEQSITLARVVQVADEVIVKGARFGQSKALNEQRESANIKNIISEEQIQSFPDLNTAEVLQRVSGVSIQRDNGEGRFVSLRGTSPSYTNITINGQQVAYSNGENRSVELDVVSAAQLSGVEVTKVLTPDMDADAIGGSVNLKTQSAFDNESIVMNAIVGVGAHSIADGEHTRAAFNYSDVLGANKNFGVSIGVNYARTSAERHNNEQKWGSEDDVNDVEIPYALTNSEVQFSENTRDRYGLNARLEYRFTDDHEVYLGGVYNFREDDQDRQVTRVRWDKGDYISPTEVEDLRMVRSMNDRVEEQKITSVTFGGKSHFGSTLLDYSLSTSSASTKKPDGQLKPEFEYRGMNLNVVGIDSPTPDWDSATNDINDNDNYAMDKVDVKYENTTSDISAAALNFTMPMVWGGDSGDLKIGAKVRSLSKDRKDDRSQWSWEGDDDLLLGQFDSGEAVLLDTGYDLGNGTDRVAFRDFFFANQTAGAFEEEVRNDVNLGEPYEADEEVSSVYIMTTQTYGKLLLVAGVRAEYNSLDYTGANLVMNDDEVISNTNESVSSSFDHIFPNLQFRYRLSDQTNLRLAFSQGMARPDFWDAMPRSFTQIDDEEIIRGNPLLDPAISTNVDILAERFFEGIGILSGGIFYKQIDDFVFQSSSVQEGGEFDGFDVEQFENGGSADLVGVELAWQQQFSTLPGWWAGFGIYANYTYTDATSIDLGTGSDRTPLEALPEQMQHVGNLALVYERNSIISRLSANYSGKWIEEVGSDADEDEWRDAATTVDFSFTYMFNSGIDLFLQGNNLTNEVKFIYSGVSTRSAQYSMTGRSYNLGMKWTFQ